MMNAIMLWLKLGEKALASQREECRSFLPLWTSLAVLSVTSMYSKVEVAYLSLILRLHYNAEACSSYPTCGNLVTTIHLCLILRFSSILKIKSLLSFRFIPSLSPFLLFARIEGGIPSGNASDHDVKLRPLFAATYRIRQTNKLIL